MTIQFEATTQQVKQLLNATNGVEGLDDVRTAIANNLADDDSQKGEVPAEGDNAVIKRSE
ncbi:hypothetical protein FPZ42_12360 [Mucilaginibacter achroorhodeus]|uniref:Uncharacterized protein n=1 Tax=Mucilaginibacter achroorhodeus TaxID=2599294 RepID=A0A563U2G9_9SPHI|nr:hypothetical protein [Mucilaginibacter achroorhodeus]TWR25389.1 hypothetical protein FPZ42_12360 [Mucilaginibacter achroorhodeus]